MLSRRTPLRRSGLKRSLTPIRKVGRVGKYRQERKKEWIGDHPPNKDGFYICWICKKLVHISEMILEHVLPKGSTPKVIAEADSNLRPSHKLCNELKGSTRI